MAGNNMPASYGGIASGGTGLDALRERFVAAGQLVDDVVLKKYITRLTQMGILPLDEGLRGIDDVRLFKITEMVYRQDEYATYKFASVFNAVQNLNCSTFIVIDGDGGKTDFYMGVRAMDDIHSVNALENTLKNALHGQFPGVKTVGLEDEKAKELLEHVRKRNMAAVSCVANNKDEEFTDNARFLQGIDKLALAMQGRKYTAIVLAQSTPPEKLEDTRRSLEQIYTRLSPFANVQLAEGNATAISVSDALSSGIARGSSHSAGTSESDGVSEAVTRSMTEQAASSKAAKIGAGGVLTAVGALLAGPIGGFIGGSIGGAFGMAFEKTGTTGKTATATRNTSKTENDVTSTTDSKGSTHTDGHTATASRTMSLSMQNKAVINALGRIDQQLNRLNDCESLGMWECAAYFLSDDLATAEMAAGMYKALMKGETSGVETAAVNIWGNFNGGNVGLLNDYVANFIHPKFAYVPGSKDLHVTAATLVSGNELAIHMGLPRRSVCGLPVIEHADFGQEVTRLGSAYAGSGITLGNVMNMGSERGTVVKLDKDSLSSHTFITGSTGSGKSNTVYEMLRQLRAAQVPFLVVESAKGEYKDVFGQFDDVTVLGTNPKKADLLRINPFSFPEDVHVLEHLDRLTELFNVCWPMYAAMPAILKKAMERAYNDTGWDLGTGANAYAARHGAVFPVFRDVLTQIEAVIAESQYSADSKGDYAGALCTRVESLTTGLNRQIFSPDGISDADLFDKNVIVDLSRVGSSETKALIMGLLVIKLQEYRMSSTRNDGKLRHITVLEEAHNLMRRTSTEQAQESANLMGKSVELLANFIAEMRAYGEGFIIADQSPGLLDLSVIRNTNTKIILRLPDHGYRLLAGRAAGLNDAQITELAKLERGVAAVYQNDWVEPVLTKINQCQIAEKPFIWRGETRDMSERESRALIVSMLIQGRFRERLNIDAERVGLAIARADITTANRLLLGELLAAYQSNGTHDIWRDERFAELSRIATDVMDCRRKVAREAKTCVDNAALTERLAVLARNTVGDMPDVALIAIAQLLLRDFSQARGVTEIAEREAQAKLYWAWEQDTRTYGRG